MSYLMTNQATELERLRFQSRVWEFAGDHLMQRLGDGAGRSALEIGCGAMGWLGVLSRWTGPTGKVTGVDIDPRMCEAARLFCEEHGLANVEIVQDDIFATALPPATFDLVHLRFQLAPIGRATEQVTIARGFGRAGALLVLEEPDASCWRENPEAPATARLRALILEAFRLAGGDFDAGRRLPEYLRREGIEPSLDAAAVALEPGHPYLRLPLQFAASLRPRLLTLLDEAALDRLLADAAAELDDPGRWGTTFLLVQAWGRIP